MIIFLYGPDDYRRDEKRRWFVAEFVKKYGGLGVGYFDLGEAHLPAPPPDPLRGSKRAGRAQASGGQEGGFERFVEFTRNQSLFGPEKLAVVEHAFSAADEVSEKQLVAELKPLVDRKGTTVLITDSKKPVKAFDFLLKKPVLVEHFNYLEGAAWLRFVEQEAARRGVRLSRDAAVFLAEVYAGDTWRLATELEKMSLLGTSSIERRDLAHLDAELAPEFWGLMNGLRSPRLPERLAALERCFGTKEPAGKLFNILAYQWPEKLSAMAGYDLAVKSGKLGYEEVLLDLAIG
jgi:hypothetical protein